MRDNMKACQHTLNDDIVYKEVVVIGNGPSGMVTSFMLAGNVPYLKPIPDDLPIDDMLRARLSNLPQDKSLYEVDLMELAEGLEGRSQNPISLLMDTLLRPCADLGIQADPLIEWRHDAEKQIEHIVLGRGPPGGAWHTFPASVRTLSPAGWLCLPPHAQPGAARLTARAVAHYCRRYVLACKLQRYFRCGVVVCSVTPAPPAAPPCTDACPRRANFLVSGYDKSSGRGFRYACARVVTACGGGDRPNLLAPALADHALHSLADIERAVHLLSTHAASSGRAAQAVVVGSGVSAADAVRACRAGGVRVRHVHRAPPAALAALAPALYPDYAQVYRMMCDGPGGEHALYTPHPDHEVLDVRPAPAASPRPLAEMELALRPKRVRLLDLATREVTEVTADLVAVLIGSKPDLFFLRPDYDLTDACNECEDLKRKRKIEDDDRCFLRSHWRNIKHALGQSIQSCKSRYLNYAELNGNDTKRISDYKEKRDDPEDECACDDVRTECKCDTIDDTIEKRSSCRCEPLNPFSNGIGFGVNPEKPVDCRANPVAIDKRSHELLNGPKGMYALGPITGDNFVRFIPGGALALVADMHRSPALVADMHRSPALVADMHRSPPPATL